MSLKIMKTMKNMQSYSSENIICTENMNNEYKIIVNKLIKLVTIIQTVQSLEVDNKKKGFSSFVSFLTNRKQYFD